MPGQHESGAASATPLGLLSVVEDPELRQAKGRDHIEIIVEDLVDDAVNVAVREQRNHVLVSAALAMRLTTGWLRYVASGAAHLGQLASRVVELQFALNDESTVVGLVAMQDDLPVGGELEQDVNDPVRLIDFEDVIPNVVKAIERVLMHVAFVEFHEPHCGFPDHDCLMALE